jgi:hypothetical protein
LFLRLVGLLGLLALDLRKLVGVLVSLCPASLVGTIIGSLRVAVTLPLILLRVGLSVTLISARVGG